MTRFIFCDLHIGHEDSKSTVIQEAIKYVRLHTGDNKEVLGLGDWFHLEEGIEKCRNHYVTRELVQLAEEIPVRLIPGNHDIELEKKYRTAFSPIIIIEPLKEDGICYHHGHEFDWLWKWIFSWSTKIINIRTKTPGVLKGETPDSKYLISCHLVHSKAFVQLQKKAEKNNEKLRGLVLGHTHLPLKQECHEMACQLNGGDMRDSLTFIEQENDNFRLLHWDGSQWQKMWQLQIPRIQS